MVHHDHHRQGVARAILRSLEAMAAFAKGDPAPTDEEMKKAITEITTLLSNPKDLPKLLSYYETLRAGNKLAPAQRILHQRLCRLVLAEIQSHGEVTK